MIAGCRLAGEDLHPLAESFTSMASAVSGLSVDDACPPEDLSDSINKRFHDEALRRSLSSNGVLDKVRS